MKRFLDQLRRDLSMVRDGLAGRTPPPLVRRAGRAPASSVRSAGSPSRIADPSETLSGAQPVEVRLGGVSHRLMAAPGATVLEAGLAAGLPLPYSCAVGGCGTCRLSLLSGEVHLEEPNCLSLEERASRQVLACVARPLSPITVEVSR
ncbi:2Fe-2S iron-sulfur cluster-binding protein [Archangium lansingense]|uniref:2Fe-2S iron-sulfur cluster binding domain-containing protein n=1 Tax=Archangium lansingense TaxID=2995310 RepID=A0ABT4A8H4_9BACT|nr:2Fe-2S iron-sulfur cluster binding domain-containing protein [Archangium lansinium]MCY1077952.1 2Fe-2S iron-sulfur cluster binding domain-containing protein [Archangium lansinium]